MVDPVSTCDLKLFSYFSYITYFSYFSYFPYFSYFSHFSNFSYFYYFTLFHPRLTMSSTTMQSNPQTSPEI